MSKEFRHRLAFLATFLFVGATSLTLSQRTHFHEASAVILVIPLIWAYMTLSLRGMMLSCVILVGLRAAVELIPQWPVRDMAMVLQLAREVFFPFVLFFGLAIPFHIYRRRQASLLRRLVEAEALETRDRISSSLAHDFHNLLGVIAGTAERLKEDKFLSLDAARNVNTILTVGRQGEELIRQMRRNVAPPTPEGTLPKSVQCDLSDVVEREMDLIGRMLEPEVNVVRVFADQPLPVRLDVAGMLRVLMNLCLNARQAMPKGGMLTIRTAAREHLGRPMAELTISDTGTGMDAKATSHLFEPFFTTHHQDGNVGLGLSIVRAIVKSHDGLIGVRSTPQQGTTVTILLPTTAAVVPQAISA